MFFGKRYTILFTLFMYKTYMYWIIWEPMCPATFILSYSWTIKHACTVCPLRLFYTIGNLPTIILKMVKL